MAITGRVQLIRAARGCDSRRWKALLCGQQILAVALAFSREFCNDHKRNFLQLSNETCVIVNSQDKSLTTSASQESSPLALVAEACHFEA
ncbi:sphingomyelin phosphodiesterase 3-like [Platysternon megacephalum]|uniref:Sphingomyelin phosphodiesterase 3-like n=1 Tax=Platysternon megacephalum TaxID=55544 RepID=A0A4D9DW43_9SAUR|nr:sphingomyelin phosphodiesterase 3-like [Platysternon megacephalum]